jgi:hypothetical protein
MSTPVWIAQNSFVGGEISEKLFGRVELETYATSVAKLLNFRVQPHGGIIRQPGTRYGWPTKTTGTTRLIPFQSSADAGIVLEVGAGYIRFGKEGALIAPEGTIQELPTPYLEAEIPEIRFVQSADAMWLCHPNHAPRKLLRYGDEEWYLDAVAFIDGPYFPVNTGITTLVASTKFGAITVTAAGGGANVTNVIKVGSAPAYVTYITAEVTFATAHNRVVGNDFVLTGVVGATEVNNKKGTVTQVISATVFRARIWTYTQTLSPYVSGGTISPSLFAATDVGRLLRVWHSVEAKWAWGEITAYAFPYSVTVKVVENGFPTAADGGATTLWRLGKYSTRTGWPKTVTFYEQRLAYAGSTSAKQDLDLSQTDRYDWFQSAADENLLATDALGWAFYGQRTHAIHWLHPGRGGLAVGTSGGAWILTGSGGKDDPVRPDSVNAKEHAYVSSAEHVQPVAMDNAVLFVDGSGRRLHEFAYVWEDDTYRAPDMTLLADHLTRESRIEQLAVQQDAKVVWARLANGSLLGLTYMRAESVVAWHRHDLGGKVKSICCVTEGQEDVPYLIVERTINGSTVQYVEFMEPDFDGADIAEAYYVHCGIRFTLGGGVTTITGLAHLEGQTVYALCDGKVVSNLTVASGQVTVPYAGSSGCVGLNYFSDVETVPIEMTNLRSGATIGRVKDLGKIAMRLSSSYHAKVGRDFSSLEEVIFNEGLVFGEAPPLFSGEKIVDKVEGQPSTDVRVCVRQNLPFPLNISALVAHFTVTEA